MRAVRRYSILLGLATGCLMLTAVAMLLTLWADFYGTDMERIAAYAAGILFWAGLAAGEILLFCANRMFHHRHAAAYPGRPGFFRLFSTPAARISDGMLIVSLGISLYCLFGTSPGLIFETIWAAILIAAFHLHYILNGKVYRYVAGGNRSGRKRMLREEELEAGAGNIPEDRKPRDAAVSGQKGQERGGNL